MEYNVIVKHAFTSNGGGIRRRQNYISKSKRKFGACVKITRTHNTRTILRAAASWARNSALGRASCAAAARRASLRASTAALAPESFRARTAGAALNAMA
jgi:hypothetical protein